MILVPECSLVRAHSLVFLGEGRGVISAGGSLFLSLRGGAECMGLHSALRIRVVLFSVLLMS